MRSLKHISFSLLAIIILASCSMGGSEVKDPLLIEAFKYYGEAVELEKSFVGAIGKLNTKKTSIQSAGRELTEEDMNFIDAANRIEKFHKKWQENRIEVPGFGDHANCSHDHSNDVKLTPQQMVEVQKESLKDIEGILKKAEGLLQK